MVRMVEVGRREPYENPIPSWEVGRGIVTDGVSLLETNSLF
jgi:hypothetical protein